MKRWIVDDEYDYFLANSEWKGCPFTEDAELINRYDQCQAEKEDIQSKLDTIYKKHREDAILAKSKTGIPSKGFD